MAHGWNQQGSAAAMGNGESNHGPQEIRDVMDGLCLTEAVQVSNESASSFLEGVRADARHTFFPENTEMGRSWTRVVETRGMFQASFGIRMLKAQVLYHNVHSSPLAPSHGERSDSLPGVGATPSSHSVGKETSCFGSRSGLSRSIGGTSIASSTGYEASMDEEYDGNGEASRSEVVLVFAVHAPPQHLVEVLDCEDTAKRMRGIGVFGGMFGRRAGGKEVPSPSNAALPGGRRPKWCMAAEDLAAEIAEELLAPTTSSSPKARPLKRFYQTGRVRCIITGHGVGAMSAYQAAVILLNRHAVLSPILRCVVFGMPLLGFASSSERSMHLASAWEGSNRLAHFHFVLRWDDPVPPSTLDSRATRRELKEALEDTLSSHGGKYVGDAGAHHAAGGGRGVAEFWPWGTFWFLQDGGGYGGKCDIETARLGGGDDAEFGVLEACVGGSGQGGVGEQCFGRYICSVHACLGGGGGWACRPRVDSAVGIRVSEGARTWLQLCLRGQNLHYIDQVECLLPGSDATESVPAPPSHPPPSNRCYTARIDAPFGRLRGRLTVRLRGSCFAYFDVDVRGDLESFEVLGGHKVRYEAMPVSELLEKAFAYRELISSSRLVMRERGGIVHAIPLRETLKVPILGRRGGISDAKRGRPDLAAFQRAHMRSLGGCWAAGGVVEAEWGRMRMGVRMADRELERVGGRGGEEGWKVRGERDAKLKAVHEFRERMRRLGSKLSQEGLEEGGNPGSLFKVLECVLGAGSLRERVGCALKMGGDEELGNRVEGGLQGVGQGKEAEEIFGACAAVLGAKLRVLQLSVDGSADWIEYRGGAIKVDVVHLFDDVYDLLQKRVESDKGDEGKGEKGQGSEEGGGGFDETENEGGIGDLLDGLATQLSLLEARTRSSWVDFRRLMSIGTGPAMGSEPQGGSAGGSLHGEGVGGGSEAGSLRDARAMYREVMNGGEGAEQVLSMKVRPMFSAMQEFLDRPLALAMDRSGPSRRVYGLLKAVAMGGTAMAGACLLAPASAAALVPAAVAAAVTSPASAVGGTAAGVFISSLLQTHTQARSALVGPYEEKLLHFARALGIDKDRVLNSAYYLEKAISARVSEHFRSLGGQGEEFAELPRQFADAVAASWGGLVDPEHFFDYVDSGDKDVLAVYLWCILAVHRLRALIMEDVSVAVIGCKKAGKGATLNALFGLGTKSGFEQCNATRQVECFRLEGTPRPLRIDDFPGWGDTCDDTGGLTTVSYDLSAVQIVVVQWEAVQRQDTALMIASVLSRARRLGTSFIVLLNKADQVEVDDETSREILESEACMAISKVNTTLNLTAFAKFARRVRDVRRTALASGGKRPSAEEALQSIVEERVLPMTQIPSEFQLSLLKSLGALDDEAHPDSSSNGEDDESCPSEGGILSLRLERESCMVVAMKPDPLLVVRAQNNGLTGSASRVREWLCNALQGAMFGASHGGDAGNAAAVAGVFDANAIEGGISRVQACLKRYCQRHVVRMWHSFEASRASSGCVTWHCGRAEDSLWAAPGYWPPFSSPRMRHITSLRKLEDVQVVTVGAMLGRRSVFRQRFQGVLSAYFAQVQRIALLSRYAGEIERATSLPPSQSLPSAAIGTPNSRTREHVRTASASIFGSMNLQAALERDSQERGGPGAILKATYGSIPSWHELALCECFEKSLAPFFTSLVSLFTSVPLHYEARSVDQLVARLSSWPPVAKALQEFGSPLPLASALHSPFPPSLHLRILLERLRTCCPISSPDSHDIVAATKMIDYQFASAQASVDGGSTLLGSFGVFFAEFEAKFPSGKEWDVHDAAVAIDGFRQGVVAALEGGRGWDGEEDDERGVAVRTVVNALLLTRLWTDSLQAAYALLNSRQDDIIGKGLPAFDPDREAGPLMAYLHVPLAACEPGVLDSAVRTLKKMCIMPTPEAKVDVIIRARLDILSVLGGGHLTGEDEIAPCMIYSILKAANEVRREGGAASFCSDYAYIRDLYCAGEGEGQAYADMFGAMLEWISGASDDMRGSRSSGRQLSPENQNASGINACLQLAEAATACDWEKVVRLVGDIGISPMLVPDGGAASALEEASSKGHDGLVLYLLLSLAESTPTGPHGNLEFSSGCFKQLQVGRGGGIGAQNIYTLRALEMLRSHATYTARLRAVHRLAGERREWMHETDYRTLFSNTALNLLHAEQVLQDMRSCIQGCVDQREGLRGWGKVLMLGKGSALQLSIRIVLHQYDQVVEAGNLLSVLCSDESDRRWKAFVDDLESDPDLQGQRLIDILTEPCQRAIRYSTECNELLRSAAFGDPEQEIGASGITRGQARAQPSAELAARLEEWAAAGKVGLGASGEYIDDLPDVMRATIALQAEAKRLNSIRQEREMRFKAAARAQELLGGMRGHGIEELLQSPIGIAAEGSAMCDVQGRGGGAGSVCTLLLITGSVRELVVCSELSHLSVPSACHFRCQVSNITSIDTFRSSDSIPVGGGGDGGELVVKISHRRVAGSRDYDDDDDDDDAIGVFQLRAPTRSVSGASSQPSSWLMSLPFLPGARGPDADALSEFVGKLQQVVSDEVDKRRSINALKREGSSGHFHAFCYSPSPSPSPSPLR